MLLLLSLFVVHQISHPAPLFHSYSKSKAVVPVGHMARNNPQLMRQMGKSSLKTIMDGDANSKAAASSSNGVDDRRKNNNGDATQDRDGGAAAGENHSSAGANDKNSFFSQDAMQSGNVSQKSHGGAGDLNFMGMQGYYGMPGMGGGGGSHDGPGMSNGNHPDASQSPENYREFFKNMSNFFPGMPAGAGGPMAQNNVPEEFQRMMLARAMGQNAGMHNNGKKTSKPTWVSYLSRCRFTPSIKLYSY